MLVRRRRANKEDDGEEEEGSVSRYGRREIPSGRINQPVGDVIAVN